MIIGGWKEDSSLQLNKLTNLKKITILSIAEN